MLNKSVLVLFFSLVLFFVLSFSIVLAAENEDPVPEQLSPGRQEGIPNPIGENDPRKIIGNVIRAILGLVGSLALLIFIYGGFTWMMAAGNEEKIKKGKDMILWASLGIAVILLSYTLVTFVIEAVTTGVG